MLNIVADQGIPFVERLFSTIGELKLLDGRQIRPGTLGNADVLVCRTVTPVNEALLEGSSLMLIASPTSGIDHIHRASLEQRGIELVHAPGCNARAVAEYVLSALCVLAERRGFDLSGRTMGIIGCGRTGSRVHEFCRLLGMRCLRYDPFLQRKTGGDDYCELADIHECDFVTLHVPLTADGAFPTRAMVDGDFLAALAGEAVLLNTSRGGVVDERALKGYLDAGSSNAAVVDVWDNEPAIDPDLVQRADIATPHIAGYSMDGRFRAVCEVFEKTCGFFGIEPPDVPAQGVFPGEAKRRLRLDGGCSDMEVISLAVLASYDVRSDAAALRRILDGDIVDRADYFHSLRSNYPIRREFSHLRVELNGGCPSLRRKLEGLGFDLGADGARP